MRDRARVAMDSWRTTIQRIVNKGIERQEIRPGINADEVASILRVSRAVAGHLPIRSLRISGELRFRQSDVRAYLREQEQPAARRW